MLDLGTGATVLSGANGGYSTMAGCTAIRKLVLRATSVVSLTTGSCLFTSSGTSVYVPPYLEGIYVPDDLVASYQTAANWSAFSTCFKPLSDLAAS